MDGQQDKPGEIDPIARLLRGAGKRTQPSPEAVDRIRARVHAQWLISVAHRRRLRWFAVAASVATIGIAIWAGLAIRSQLPATVVARLEASQREIHVRERIDTQEGRGLAIRALGEHPLTLRLAANSSLRWDGPLEVRLLRGELYVDSGNTNAARERPHLVVHAGPARIEHIGTQFLTALSDQQVDVAVREGTVRFQGAGETALLSRGELGRFRAAGSGSGSRIERSRIDTMGEYWSWVDSLAPMVSVEGQSLRAVLQQLAHEGGLELRFDSAALEAEAGITILHGPSLNLPPLQALRAVLATTELAGELQAQEAQFLVRAR